MLGIGRTHIYSPPRCCSFMKAPSFPSYSFLWKKMVYAFIFFPFLFCWKPSDFIRPSSSSEQSAFALERCSLYFPCITNVEATTDDKLIGKPFRIHNRFFIHASLSYTSDGALNYSNHRPSFFHRTMVEAHYIMHQWAGRASLF